MQYSQDNDETLPNHSNTNDDDYANTPIGEWISGTQPYLKSWQVFVCPSAKISSYGIVTSPNPSDTNYVANGVLIQRKLSQISNPAGIIWAQENITRWKYAVVRPMPRTDVTYPLHSTDTLTLWLYSYGSDEKMSALHFDGGNLLFTDGHVKWRKLTGICAKDYGLLASAADACGEVSTSATATADPTQIS